MKISPRHKLDHKRKIPQRAFAARQDRKWRRHHRRLHRLARRQHRRFQAALPCYLPAIAKDLSPCLTELPPGGMVVINDQGVDRGPIVMQAAAVKPKPSLWQRVKRGLGKWFGKHKMSENPAL